MLIVFSLQHYGQSLQTSSALNDFLNDNEKRKKPALSRQESLALSLEMQAERTRILLDAIETGRTDDIKKSSDPDARQMFLATVSARVLDKACIDHQLAEEELSFACRFYKIDQEPAFQNKVQEDYIAICTKKMEASAAAETAASTATLQTE